jgi:predicted secreted protein
MFCYKSVDEHTDLEEYTLMELSILIKVLKNKYRLGSMYLPLAERERLDRAKQVYSQKCLRMQKRKKQFNIDLLYTTEFNNEVTRKQAW